VIYIEIFNFVFNSGYKIWKVKVVCAVPYDEKMTSVVTVQAWNFMTQKQSHLCFFC